MRPFLRLEYEQKSCLNIRKLLYSRSLSVSTDSFLHHPLKFYNQSTSTFVTFLSVLASTNTDPVVLYESGFHKTTHLINKLLGGQYED